MGADPGSTGIPRRPCRQGHNTWILEDRLEDDIRSRHWHYSTAAAHTTDGCGNASYEDRGMPPSLIFAPSLRLPSFFVRTPIMAAIGPVPSGRVELLSANLGPANAATSMKNPSAAQLCELSLCACVCVCV